MSYGAWPLLAVHYSYGAKLFGFESTNVTINLYLVVLKLAIYIFSTTNINALMVVLIIRPRH